MPNVTNTIQGFDRRPASRRRGGFSLVELMCVIAIISVMASITWPSIVGLVSGNRLTNNAFELGGLMQQARAAALTEHTYVWVGFSATTQNGSPSLLVASVMSNSGMATDPQNGGIANFQPVFKPVILKGVALATAPNYAALPGLDSTNNTDAGSQTYTFQMNTLGIASAQFSDVIVFGPDGQAYLPASTGTLSAAPVQCVGVGLNAAPSSSVAHTVAVQVRGLSGQVSVFQQ